MTATPQPAVPEINYPALIEAAFAKNRKWTQGTTGCIAFARGAEWFRDQMLAATPAAPSQPVNRPQNCGTSFCSCIECVCEPSQEPLTNFDAIPDEVIDTAQEKSGMYRVELMRAWDAIIAALREKEAKVTP